VARNLAADDLAEHRVCHRCDPRQRFVQALLSLICRSSVRCVGRKELL
jgi:hypothetical protein